MSAEKFIANSLCVARIDLDDANALEARGSRNAVYHCEQAAEKIIKAILTSEKINVPQRNHELKDMIDLIPDANPLKLPLREIQSLTFYATTYRYVTPQGRIPDPPDSTKLTDFIQKVEAILTTTASRFGVILTQENVPAKNSTPIR
jgi:HEPN domain-containing protein